MEAKPYLLMEVGSEIHEFLETIEVHDLPTVDLSSVLDQVFGAFVNPSNPETDRSICELIAGSMAYGDGMHEGIYEGAGLNPNKKQCIYNAVMRLGERMRFRLIALNLTEPDGRAYSHRFKEIERDHLLRLEKENL